MFHLLSQLEARFEKLRLDVKDMSQKVTTALQLIRDLQARPVVASGGGGNVYFCDPVVISPAGSVTGQTVYQLVGGTPTAVTSSGTIYNRAAVATVSTAGKTIFLGPNGDGSYLVISQSC